VEKAYDSEEITTKAAKWRREIMCVSNDAVHVLCERRKVMTDERGAKSNREPERGGLFTPPPDWERQHNWEWEMRFSKWPWGPSKYLQRGGC